MALGFLKKPKTNSGAIQDIRNPFLLCLECAPFCYYQIQNLWARVIERTLKRCVFTGKNSQQIIRSYYTSAGEDGKGLVDYVAEAMQCASVIYLVWENEVLREMTSEERKLYDEKSLAEKKRAKGMIALDFSFMERKSMLAKIYFSHLFLLNQVRATQWGVAGALVLTSGDSSAIGALTEHKIDMLKDDAAGIARSIKSAGAAWLPKDAKIGGVESINVQIIQNGRDETMKELAQSVDLPYSFITNTITTGGLSVNSEADIVAEGESLEIYYYAVCEPLLTQLYGVKDVSYRTERWKAARERIASVLTLEATEFWRLRTSEEKAEIWKELLQLGDSNLAEQEQMKGENNGTNTRRTSAT